jgi:hypothetical protein
MRYSIHHHNSSEPAIAFTEFFPDALVVARAISEHFKCDTCVKVDGKVRCVYDQHRGFINAESPFAKIPDNFADDGAKYDGVPADTGSR